MLFIKIILMIEIVPVRAIVRAFNIAVKLRWLKRRIIAEVAGSSPATATKNNSKTSES